MTPRHGRGLLALLLLSELLLLSRQVARGGPESPPLERAAIAALGPLARGVTAAKSTASRFLERRRHRRRLLGENEVLRQRVGELERELLRHSALEGDLQRLAAAVRYSRETGPGAVQLADVVYADHGSFLRSVLLYTGRFPARSDQAVVDRDGLVGRVLGAAGGYAKVQLVTDRASAVGAMIERTRRQGIVRGDGQGRLRLEYVPASAEVRIGDRVVTAGIDGVYPRGLVVGVVVELERGADLFRGIVLTPSVDFGRLDQVYLLPVPDRPEDFDAER